MVFGSLSSTLYEGGQVARRANPHRGREPPAGSSSQRRSAVLRGSPGIFTDGSPEHAGTHCASPPGGAERPMTSRLFHLTLRGRESALARSARSSVEIAQLQSQLPQ